MKKTIYILAMALCLAISQGANAQILKTLASSQQAETDVNIQKISSWLTDHANIKYSDADGRYTSRLMAASPLPVTLDELTEYTRVKSIQMDDTGLYAYDYFACRIYWEVENLCFRKTKGSQLKAGLLSQVNDRLIKYEGWWFINGDRERDDEEHHQTGYITKVSTHKVILTIDKGDGRYEILEFAKENGPTAFTIEDANGYLYSFITDQYGTEELALEPGGRYDGDIVIPNLIEYDGISYSVSTIRRGAMWKKPGADNIGTITSVTLPPSVWIVGGDAFRGNHSLKKVTYDVMTRIENRAFFDCPQLKLNPQEPKFAYTDPMKKTRDLAGMVMPYDEPDPALEGLKWGFFKQNHNAISFERWKSMDVEDAMGCYCSNLNAVKGAVYNFRNMDLNESLFKGYMNNSGHYMILADNDYVGTHDFPAFSRWIWGENEKLMPADFIKQMQAKYGEVASCFEAGKVTTTKDQLAITEFVIKNGEARFVLSWVKNGKEVCSYTETTKVEGEYGVWNVDDEGSWGIPHILTVAYDEKGNVDLFLVHNAPETVAYMHLRQKGTKLELVQENDLYVRYDWPYPQIKVKKDIILSAWTGEGIPDEYAMYDIDGDGQKELFLSNGMTGDMEVFTIDNGTVDQLASINGMGPQWLEAADGYLYMCVVMGMQEEKLAMKLKDSKVTGKYLRYWDADAEKVTHSFILDPLTSEGKDVKYSEIQKHFDIETKGMYELLADRWYKLDWDFQWDGQE
ncbi:MAG: hypothetical protein MJZ09_01420 [Bacteroidales bacterium]|nr:hypothetical protein [Bacteroidales bacterium]